MFFDPIVADNQMPQWIADSRDLSIFSGKLGRCCPTVKQHINFARL
jgi:hypothetical protein